MRGQPNVGTGVVFVEGSKPADAQRVVRKLSKTRGVHSVDFNYVTHNLTIKYDPRQIAFADIRAISKAVGS